MLKNIKKNRSFDKYFCVLSTLNDILFREFNLGFLEDSNPLTSMKNKKKKKSEIGEIHVCLKTNKNQIFVKKSFCEVSTLNDLLFRV